MVMYEQKGGLIQEARRWAGLKVTLLTSCDGQKTLGGLCCALNFSNSDLVLVASLLKCVKGALKRVDLFKAVGWIVEAGAENH